MLKYYWSNSNLTNFFFNKTFSYTNMFLLHTHRTAKHIFPCILFILFLTCSLEIESKMAAKRICPVSQTPEPFSQCIFRVSFLDFTLFLGCFCSFRPHRYDPHWLGNCISNMVSGFINVKLFVISYSICQYVLFVINKNFLFWFI